MDFREMWLFLFLIFFSKNLPRKLKFLFKPDKYNGRFKFTKMSRSVLLRTINVSDRSCREKTHGWIFVKCGFLIFDLFFRKICQENWSFFLNRTNITDVLSSRKCLAQFFLEREMFRTEVVEKKHMDGFSWNVVFWYLIFFFEKSAQKIEVSF